MGIISGAWWTSDHSPRTRKVGGVVLHHAAMVKQPGILVRAALRLFRALANLLGLMQPGGRQVSAHVGIEDGQVVQAVPFDRRAWSLADAYWDSWAVTAECINSSANGWTLSAATHESIAQYVAEMARRFGFYPHRNGNPKTWTVIGHREVYTIHGGSYATACPGGMDLNWITKRAQQILGGKVPAPAALPAAEKPTWAGYPIEDIQKLLGKHGFPTEVDEIYGPDTTRQVRVLQEAYGLEPDGDVGPDTWKVLNGPVKTKTPSKPKPTSSKAPAFPLPEGWYFGPKEGPIQSVSGYYGHRAELKQFMAQMERRGWDFSEHGIDGLYGDELRGNVIAFQEEKGLTVDGLIGPETWAAAWEAPVT
ncbi:peptidoglycan recognition protein family protein [Microbacterium stercoris]|uniref:N-acetylmuramoyl-L-alanine amidase n=1 Tax=Microbacterium stercoris TaxID=2820289 RepID=A0A939QSD1_9MICO|nr:N-acetylmuramoyl-L-alanine amidase [Microbacterium stercoris]MBO3663746.1 N-acetylmuramoyl-L-alanine amidase [Microbacterium stercoris]